MGRRFHPRVLRGWKEIARFFNVHPNTIRRWERAYGLPIHRMPRPMALSEELENWARGKK